MFWSSVLSREVVLYFFVEFIIYIFLLRIDRILFKVFLYPVIAYGTILFLYLIVS